MKPQGASTFFPNMGLFLTFRSIFSRHESSQGRLWPWARLRTAGASEQAGLCQGWRKARVPLMETLFLGERQEGRRGGKSHHFISIFCKHIHLGPVKGLARQDRRHFLPPRPLGGYFPVGALHRPHEPPLPHTLLAASQLRLRKSFIYTHLAACLFPN